MVGFLALGFHEGLNHVPVLRRREPFAAVYLRLCHTGMWKGGCFRPASCGGSVGFGEVASGALSTAPGTLVTAPPAPCHHTVGAIGV